MPHLALPATPRGLRVPATAALVAALAIGGGALALRHRHPLKTAGWRSSRSSRRRRRPIWPPR